MAGAQFAIVDWGTSSFRLWLIGEADAVLAESRSGEGMTSARELGFAKVLHHHLSIAGAPDALPVVICGMAGAKQGWKEAGYIDVPARLSDIADFAVRLDTEDRDVRILPGLAQRDPRAADVIRGEETQLLGCTQRMKSSDCLVAMPGTHSKWVRVVRGEVLGFSTFMTGELFAAITQHTILTHAVAGSAGFEPADPHFAEAVYATFKEPELVASRLFGVRAHSLLFPQAAAEAEARLSGTMIGLELAGALKSAPKNTPVVLVASGKLRGLYEAAFHRVGLKFSTVDADDAVRQGLIHAARSIWPAKEDL